LLPWVSSWVCLLREGSGQIMSKTFFSEALVLDETLSGSHMSSVCQLLRLACALPPIGPAHTHLLTNDTDTEEVFQRAGTNPPRHVQGAISLTGTGTFVGRGFYRAEQTTDNAMFTGTGLIQGAPPPLFPPNSSNVCRRQISFYAFKTLIFVMI